MNDKILINKNRYITHKSIPVVQFPRTPLSFANCFVIFLIPSLLILLLSIDIEKSYFCCEINVSTTKRKSRGSKKPYNENQFFNL